MAIVEIAFTGLPISNIEVSRKFYDDLLMAEPFFQTPDGKLFEYRVGNGILNIGNLGDTFKPSSDGTFIALEADVFESEIERISGLGAKIIVPRVELPTSVFAIILDPDGNKIMIHKAKIEA